MKKTRLICAALLALAAPVLWAGGKSPQQSGGTAPGTVTATVLSTHWAPYPLPAEESVIFKALEERTGLRFRFDWRQSTDYNTQLATLLASGNLPDVMNPGGLTGAVVMKDEGAIIALDDLLQKSGQNIINAVGPSRMASWRQVDGHIYTFTGIVGIQGSHSWMIRKDWLDKLGMKEPSTWNEWLTVWRAFRDNDMNGDGDKTNEIPLSIDTLGTRAIAPVMWAFGILASADGQFCVYNNNYIPVYEHPRYAEFLRAAAGLYQEGILDREFATRTQADLFTIMDSGLCGSTMTWSERASISTTTNRANNPAAFWRTVAPPKGPAGDQYIQARNWQNTSYSITTAAQKAGKAEKIVRAFDYLFSDKGVELYSFGVEGETFDLVNGKPSIRANLLADSFTSYRTAGLGYEPFPGIWSEDAYMQCLTRGQGYDQLGDQVKSFYDGLFTVNKPYYYDQVQTLNTEAYIRYSADLIINGVCVLRDRCIAGQISADEFTAQYQALKARGFQQIIDQGAAAWTAKNK